jgi:DNA adenine methylase
MTVSTVPARPNAASRKTAGRPALYDPKGPAAPVAWYGGKFLQAEWIMANMPAHEVYLEPFGGMANVLLKKVPAEVEIYNDLDSRLTNFFRVIRDPEKLAELKRLAELTPHSREEFARLCNEPEPESDVLRAYRFFALARMARGGLAGKITPSAWATSTRPRREMPEPISKYLSALDGLDAVADRFRRVVIEHLPAVEAIKK